MDVERGFAEEMLATLAAELQQRALDRADAGLADVAVGNGQFVGAIGAFGQHRLKIVEVEDQQPFLVRDVEGDVQHAFLHLVQVEQPREQQRAHFADGGADGVALLPEQVPELDGRVGIGPVGHADLGGARGEDLVGLGLGRSGHGQAGKVALHVGDEARHALAAEPLDDALQGNGLAGAGRAGDQPVAVGALEDEFLPRPVRAGTDEDRVGHPLSLALFRPGIADVRLSRQLTHARSS